MTKVKNRSLYTAKHPRKPFRAGVLDDTLDANPPYHLYEGELTPEDVAAGERKARELGVVPKPGMSVLTNGRARKGERLRPGL
jgi:hypothetical protein